MEEQTVHVFATLAQVYPSKQELHVLLVASSQVLQPAEHAVQYVSAVEDPTVAK